MTIDSNHGYGLTFNGAVTAGASAAYTNVGNGTVTFAALALYESAASREP